MKPSFQQTVDVLVKAYLNDTLQHGDCGACAVGNIIADKLGCEVVIDAVNLDSTWERGGIQLIIGWQDVFATRRGRQEINPRNYIGQVKRQIDASGYTWKELAKIEAAFEAAADYDDKYEIANKDESMFNGLMAVVDVLAEIHGIDLTAKEQAKLLFVKA